MKNNLNRNAILIQNYHTSATKALARDFKKIGLDVISPDSDWGMIPSFATNTVIGSALVSYDEFINHPPLYVLIPCKHHEETLKNLADRVNSTIILSVAQQYHEYNPGISDIMLCPDIGLYLGYSSFVKHKILYFPRPHLDASPVKDLRSSYLSKTINSYISLPKHWPVGAKCFAEFKRLYKHKCAWYGLEAEDGELLHHQCHEKMVESLFTVHFKEQEAYGLSCLESMMLGTPVIGLRNLMYGTTLGAFFLDKKTSIIASSIEELVEQVNGVSFDQYEEMSKNCVNRVLDLTSDKKTVDVLRNVLAPEVSLKSEKTARRWNLRSLLEW